MSTIHIKNPDSLIEQASELQQVTNNILNLDEELDAVSKRISNAWASDTVDKESYLKVFNENIQKIQTLVSALSALSKNLQTYAEQQKQNSNG